MLSWLKNFLIGFVTADTVFCGTSLSVPAFARDIFFIANQKIAEIFLDIIIGIGLILGI